MNRTRSIYALVVGLSLSPALTAQQADTLRRQLQVLTSEEIQMEPRLPLGLVPTAPAGQPVKVLQFRPRPLDRQQAPGISPLRQLTPLSGLDSTAQIGYAELAGGLRYNGYLNAGLRPLNGKHSVLDLAIRGQLTNYQVSDDPASSRYGTIKEHRLQIGASYLWRRQHGNSLEFKVNYKLTGNNYNAQEDAHIRAKHFRFEASWANPDAPDSLRWHYRITPYLTQTHAQDKILGVEGWKHKEYQVGAKGEVSYRLREQHQAGFSSEVYYLNGNRHEERTVHQDRWWYYPSMFAFRFAPYFQLSPSSSWSLLVGLGLDIYNKADVSHALVSPQVALSVRLGRSWILLWTAEGGVDPNGLNDLLEQMPYLRLNVGASATRRPVDTRLKLSGLIAPNFQAEAFARYAEYKDGVDFVWDKMSYTPTPPAPAYVGYYVAPVAGDGKLLSFGAKAAYRFANAFTLSGQLTYSKWTDDLYGNPSLEARTELVYKPTERFELRAGYSLIAGTKLDVFEQNQLSSDLISLPAYSSLRLGTSYRLARAWTLTAWGHFVPNADATLYYGYTPQRVAANLGLSYTF